MTTYTAECKYCNKKFEVKSKWLPSSGLDLIMEIKGLCHGIAKHRKKLTIKGTFRTLGRIVKHFFKSFLALIILPIALLFYPLYLLLSLLYE